MIKIRPAKKDDKDIISFISKRSWNNEETEYEYLPHVFDEWLSDTKGQFVVAELNNEVVGCAKLTFIEPNSAWLEGLRVAYNKQGHGIGKALQQYFVDQLPHYDVIRLSTFINNHASLHIIKKQGFQEMASFTVYETEVCELSSNNYDNIRIVNDYAEIKSYISKKQLKISNNFIGFEWLFKPLTDDLLKELVVTNNVYGIYNNKLLQSLMILSKKHCKESGICINYLQYKSEKDAINLINFAKNKALTTKINKVTYMCPDISNMRELFTSNGFYSYSDDINNVFVYELKQQ